MAKTIHNFVRQLICISYNPFFRNMAKKASKEVRSFLSEIGRIGGTTGKGTQKSLDKTRAARAAREAKRQYPRLEFVTGGCGHGNNLEKAYIYCIRPDAYTVKLKYDRGASRKAGAKNWVLDTPGAERFPTREEAMAFAAKWTSEQSR